MKKTVVVLLSLIAMMAASVDLKAQEITVTLSYGWNWISYPNPEVMDVASALGDFVPMEGDIIRSKFASSIYVGGRWSGSLTQFMPGWGYKYYSMRAEDIEFAFVCTSFSDVATSTPTGITARSAVLGGTVTVPEGGHVFLCGVCWGTDPNPDIDGNHTSNGMGIGVFSDTLVGLHPNTAYYVRAYAVTDRALAYGEELSFTTTEFEYEYVDLGLPSGTLWATCNVGAYAPEEYGDHFAWGETQSKDVYSWSNYIYAEGTSLEDPKLTKYCNNSNYGNNGFTDNLTTLLPEDDAATANWGADWRIPTLDEWQELLNTTTYTWTTQNGVSGTLFSASNGNSLFLPVAGYHLDSSLCYAGDLGDYWSSSLITDYPNVAGTFFFASGGCDIGEGNRCYGRSVRPVRFSTQNNAPTGAINGKFTVNSNGNQVYFSQGNLQYIGSASTPYWKFAENQWDCLGTTTGQNSTDQNVDRDLFGWGTSGWNPGNSCYHPWDTFNSTGSTYGPAGANNLTGTYANSDWGFYNPISNGGNQSEQWRTPTKEELGYVFDTRTTDAGIRFAKANVNNVNGVILLPDDWNVRYYNLIDTNMKEASYTSNIITASEWSFLERLGAVFLPANGYRFGASVRNVGVNGYYWSSSFVNGNYAYGLYFYDSNLNAQDCSNRTYGRSVRLIQAAE